MLGPEHGQGRGVKPGDGTDHTEPGPRGYCVAAAGSFFNDPW